MLLPVFVLFSSAATSWASHIIGTRWGLFLTYLTFAMPFSTWVMVTYLRGLPRELEEAARIDGAGTLGILFRIVLPLSWPAIVVSGIFAFLLGWNDVLFASVMTRPESQTAAVALQVFGASAGRRRHSRLRPDDGRRPGLRRSSGHPLPRFPAIPSGRPDRRRSQMTP